MNDFLRRHRWEATHGDTKWRIPAIVGFIGLVLMLLTGCATDAYWHRSHAPVLIRQVAIVDTPCGRADWRGCSNLATGVIEIRRGLPDIEHACVLSHERRHMAGYDHHTGTHYATDCGDGTILGALR